MTITVDAETLERAQRRALQRKESVNAYLAGVLKRYAEGTTAMDDVIALAQDNAAGAAGTERTWTREELHRG